MTPMDLAHAPALQRQLARARRRMTAQKLLEAAAWCGTASLALAIVWFLVEPYVVRVPPPWLRWVVAGSVCVAGILAAMARTGSRAPSRLEAALALDTKFNLKERVTTALCLSPQERETPAGQALLADASERMASLDIPSRFPVRLPRSAAAVPLAGIVLAAVALFYEPSPEQATAGDVAEAQPPANAAEIDEQIRKAAQRKRTPTKPEQEAKSPRLAQLDDDLDKLLNQPHDTREAVRERLKEMTALEDKLRDEEKGRVDRAEAVKEQLQQMDRLAKKEKKNGPGDDLDKAVKDGDLNKAKEEMDRLSKKLKNNELTDKEKQQLNDQLQDVQNKLERLSREKDNQADEEEKLRDLAKQGDLDPEALDRELDQLRQNANKLDPETQKELQEAADELKKAEQAMKEGKEEEAAEHLRKAGEQMEKAQGDQEGQDAAEQMRMVREVRRTLARGLGDKPGQGRRPEDKDGETKSKDTMVQGPFDAKGKKEVAGTTAGSGTFKKKTTAEITPEIHQASQEAPQAIEHQRIPRAASDMAKGYFEKLGNQGDGKPKP
jgi:hypothetical protein